MEMIENETYVKKFTKESHKRTANCVRNFLKYSDVSNGQNTDKQYFLFSK